MIESKRLVAYVLSVFMLAACAREAPPRTEATAVVVAHPLDGTGEGGGPTNEDVPGPIGHIRANHAFGTGQLSGAHHPDVDSRDGGL